MGLDARAGFKLTPVWLLTVVCCGLLIYVVVKKIDDIREVKVEGTGGGIVFAGNASAASLPPAEQRERSQQIDKNVEAEIRKASPPSPPAPVNEAPAVDLSGTWTTQDGLATWTVARENNLYAFREESVALPGVISAAGYGAFDGRTWSLQFQTIIGAVGTASVHLQDDGTLSGQGVVLGNQIPLSLHR